MKILIVRPYPSYLNVQNVQYNLQEIGLAKAFNRKGHQCDVVYYTNGKAETVAIEYAPEKYFSVFYVKAINILKNGLFFGLNKLAAQYDAIHCCEYDQLQTWLLAKKFPEKLVIYHGTYYSDFNKRYNAKCKVFDALFLPCYLKRNIAFTAKSSFSAEFVRQRGVKNVTPIGVGIDLERLSASEITKSSFSNRLQQLKDNGEQLLLYVGKLEPRRNIIFLLDVFAKVSAQTKNTKLVIIGAGDAAYKEACFSHAEALGIKEQIIYQEYLEQAFLPAVYQTCDVFLLPTLYEIFGMVLLEAMYFGACVVTSHNGGSDVLIENAKNGFIIKNFDCDVWANQINEILQSGVLQAQINALAYERIQKHFTWDALMDVFLVAFKENVEARG